MSVDPLADAYPEISPYAYVANNPINMIDPDGRYIVPAAFAQKYKMIAKYLQNNIQADVMGSDRILRAMHQESQGNLTRDKVLEAVSNNSGPTIIARSDKIGGDIDAGGAYEYSSNEIHLRGADLDRIEAILSGDASESEKLEALTPLFMTITHETVHYGDYLDGSKYYDGIEHGEAFEQEVWLGTPYLDTETGEKSLIYGMYNLDNKTELREVINKNPDALPTVPKNE